MVLQLQPAPWGRAVPVVQVEMAVMHGIGILFTTMRIWAAVLVERSAEVEAEAVQAAARAEEVVVQRR